MTFSAFSNFTLKKKSKKFERTKIGHLELDIEGEKAVP